MQSDLVPQNVGPDQKDWVKAEVPGTVYAAFVKQGLEKDPNFADNIWVADRNKFDKPFWYTTSFSVPASFDKKKIWLNFDGVNRNAKVYLNGKLLGDVKNFMDNARFEISASVRKNGNNELAVLVDIPKTPMANLASPTYISSAGWDWMPYVPGLNSGITDKVFLSNSNDLTIQDPWIQTDLPTLARADLKISFGVNNPSHEGKQATIRGTINPGNITFEEKFTVSGSEPTTISLNKKDLPQLSIDQPKLWWPNGYGDPNLYTCKLSLVLDGTVSDEKEITFGIKKYTYDTVDSVLHLSVNGTRVFAKGGNWSMSEYMLRTTDKEYDTKVRLQKEMNFNMIRNWVGSVTDAAFYEACDRYGIMVWDDFWLNSSPNLPRDIHEFNAAAISKIKRLRNHPSIAVWCGDNEGWPEQPLNSWLKEAIRMYDGASRYYQANSRADNLSGSGPWATKDPRYYFTAYPKGGGGNDGWGFRTELGTAVFTNVESFKKFIPADKLWPRNDMWEKHYFGNWAFNADPDGYERMINERYGKPQGIEEFCEKAQLVNIESNKAMYEGWLDNMWEDASGIMTWTSNASLPTLIWQTYDYYYDLTGAYWGAKKACEPIHIQWNPVNNAVKVINTTAESMNGLNATATVYNLDGSEVSKYRLNKSAINSHSNSATRVFSMAFPDENRDLALKRDIVASSTSEGKAAAIADGDHTTRWASDSKNDQWVYVDLNQSDVIRGIKLNWEDAYAKKFSVQISDDAKTWKDVLVDVSGAKGKQELLFPKDEKARYVRLALKERATSWGFSLWDFNVLGGNMIDPALSATHFIKLSLTDREGKLISDNFLLER
jgi:Beta-galactosidase/beta-glucuronidase